MPCRVMWIIYVVVNKYCLRAEAFTQNIIYDITPSSACANESYFIHIMGYPIINPVEGIDWLSEGEEYIYLQRPEPRIK